MAASAFELVNIFLLPSIVMALVLLPVEGLFKYTILLSDKFSSTVTVKPPE